MRRVSVRLGALLVGVGLLVPGGAGADASAEAPGEAAWPRLLVLPSARAEAVPGRVAKALERVARQVAGEAGYEVVPEAEARALAQRFLVPRPASAADLWRLGWAAGVRRVLQLRLGADGERYVVGWLLANLDGAPPVDGMLRAPADRVREALAEALAEALPPPERWDPQAHRRLAALARPMPRAVAGRGAATEQGLPPRRAERAAPKHPWGLAPTVAVGTRLDEQGGVLLFAGLRLDRVVVGGEVSRVALGLTVLYANLPGRAQRVDNVLAWADLSNELRPWTRVDAWLLFRLGLGWLPRNGAALRAGVGGHLPLSERWSLVAEPATLSFWLLSPRLAVSWDPLLQLRWRW